MYIEKLAQFKRPLTLLSLVVLFGVLLALQARGATYTWDGGGADNNWSTCANWTSDTCPGSGDIAHFDSSTTTDSVVDASFAGSVAGVDIDSGYTGTITQERNLTIGGSSYNQADGTWKQGTTTFDLNGSYTLSGGTFEAGTGTSTITGNFSMTGGTYNASSTRTITMDGTSGSTVSCPGAADGIPGVNLGKSQSNDNVTISNCTATSSGAISHPAHLTINSDARFHFSGTININGGFTNNGTTSMSVTTFNIDSSFAQNGHFDLTGKTVNMDGTSGATLSCPGSPDGIESVDFSKSQSNDNITISNCTATSSGSISHPAALTVNSDAQLHINGNVNISSFTNNGTTTMSGTTFDLGGTLNQNAVFDLTGITVDMDGTSGGSLSCTGGPVPKLTITKQQSNDNVSISNCTASTSANVSHPAAMTFGSNTTIDFGPYNFTVSGSYSIGSNVTLYLDGDQTITTPPLASDTLVVYTGTTTYSDLIAGASYADLKFVGGGTYNIGSSVTVSGDLTSSNGSTFNQTSGTFTLDGSGTQTVTGTSTFNNLTKTVTATSSLFFGANQEQTVSGTLTLQGDSGNTLYVKSTATGTQWKMDMQSFRILEYLTISDGNNTNAATAYCDTGCTNGGNNTNISFSADPDNGYLYWDGGGGDNNWSTCANWKLDTCPTVASVAAFDDRDVTNSTLDASFAGSVKGLSIESGYTGTITSNRSLTVGSTGFSLADGTFTAPASTLTIGGDFTHSGGTFAHNSGSINFISDGTVTSTTSTAFNDIAVKGSPYSNSLLAYWKFDEGSGTSAADSSGNGNTGTLQNMESADWSTNDKAPLSISNDASLGTNASNEYVSVSVDIGTDWTIATWFKWPLESTGSWNTLTRGNADHQVIVRRSDNQLGTYDNDGGSSFVGSGYDMDNLSNGWHHLAAVGSGSQTEFFINGSSVGTAAEKSTTDIIAVGNYQGGGQQWGRMDDFRVYSVALTEAQIDTLINGGPVTATLAGAALDVNGTTTINSGSTLDASASGCSGGSCDIEVAGNWTNNGTFTPRSGTVTFDGTNQTVSGDTTFNNFTKSVTSADTITFGAGDTQTINGTFTLKGASGNLLTATSSSDGTQWKVNANTYNSTVEYVDLNDSHSINTTISMYCFPGCSDGGNNTNWLFEERPDGRERWRIDGNVRFQGDIQMSQ